MKTQIRSTGSKIRNGSIGFMRIAARMSKSSASSMMRLPPLSPAEQRCGQLSTKINKRGFYIDRTFAEAARQIAQAAAPEIDAELAKITGGAVTTIAQVATAAAVAAGARLHAAEARP